MRKVTIIGNNADNRPISDGGRLKIRLYISLLQKCGVEVEVIDLYRWILRIPVLVRRIKRAIRSGGAILIMAGPKGCRFIIPLVNRLNRSHIARTVFCPLGIGTIDHVIKELDSTQVAAFIGGRDYFGLSDEKMGRALSSLDLVIPQNEQLVHLYQDFYGLSNVRLLRNFRDCPIEPKRYDPRPGQLSIVFASRVCENKGVFDLLETVTALRKKGMNIRLAIYGELQLSEPQLEDFNKFLNDSIVYMGVAPFDKMIGVIQSHDLFCLPTKYYGEGTSGAMIESFISGTPVLISSYSQASSLVSDGETGFIFTLGNIESLGEKIEFIHEHKSILEQIGTAAQKMAQKYLFEFNKDVFLSSIVGE